MEQKEPLLPSVSLPRSIPPAAAATLCPLPENEELILPSSYPLTPSELKDHLIFGTSPSSPSSCSNILDALNLNLNSPRKASLDSPNSSFFHESSNLEASQSQPTWLTDPNIPWAQGRFHRCRTAPAMSAINDFNHHHSSDSGPPGSGSQSSIIRQAVVLLMLYLALGVGIYSLDKDSFKGEETHPVVDALYFCIVTMCTIGYGDITPSSTTTKLFSILFVLVGFGFIDILLSAMVCYVLDLEETYLLKTLKCDNDAGRLLFDVKKGRMRIRMKVALALVVVVNCIGTGVAFLHFVEKLDWVDSFYLSVMSVTTVGYGDRAFNTLSGRIFASIWLLVSTLAVARAFLFLAEARVDKRHRKMAKWVLGQNMTVAQFLAADTDNNGLINKSEYVIYKLKEMGKVSDKDVLLISKQFERLDRGNFGKITLSDLVEACPQG